MVIVRAVVLLFLIAAAASGALAEESAKDVGTRLHNVSTVEELVSAVATIGKMGGTIVLAPGHYVLRQTITFSGANHVSISGSGWDTAIQKIGDGDLFVFENSGFCTVRNLLMSGDSSAKSGSGIVFRGELGSSSCTVDYCRISNFPVSGIRFEGDIKKPLSSNTVSNCHFIGNLRDQLYSFCNNDFFIRGNQFGTHGAHPQTGCVLDHSSAGTYTENYHWGNEVAFRMGPSSNFNRIENNRFEESDREGMLIGQKGGGSYLNIITGNTIHTNSKRRLGGYAAVVAVDAVDITFCVNQIFSWDSEHYKHKSGLVVGEGCKSWIIKDNIIRSSTEKPLVYSEDAGHVVKDNIY